MKLVCLADTHGLHAQAAIPPGDVLVHAGDFTARGEPHEATAFLRWFADQPHRHKVFIAGNHDFCCEDFPDEFTRAVNRRSGVHYLCDSGVTLDGVNFWGSPFTPRFYDWAFNCDRGADLQSHWDCIPADTHVLITHGPPHGIGDRNSRGNHEGCENLRDTLKKLRALRFHVCGHIHEGYGCHPFDDNLTVVNAALLSASYTLTKAPAVIEVPSAPPGGPVNRYHDMVPLTGHRLGTWPRLRDLPEAERTPFVRWLGPAPRPEFDGVAPEDQDGYFPWDREEWLKGTPGPWL